MECQFSPFECDKADKELTGRKFKEYLETNYTVKVDTALTTDERDRIDILFTASTENGRRLGFIELKARNVAPGTYMDEMANKEKFDNKRVRELFANGYDNYLWASYYKPSGDIYIWDTKDVDKTEKTYDISKYTVIPSDKITQTRYSFNFDKTIMRIKV